MGQSYEMFDRSTHYVDANGELVPVPVPGLVAHGNHDQKSHGNWAHGEGEVLGDVDISPNYDYGIAARVNAARDEMQAELNRLDYSRSNNRITSSEYSRGVANAERRFEQARDEIQAEQRQSHVQDLIRGGVNEIAEQRRKYLEASVQKGGWPRTRYHVEDGYGNILTKERFGTPEEAQARLDTIKREAYRKIEETKARIGEIKKKAGIVDDSHEALSPTPEAYKGLDTGSVVSSKAGAGVDALVAELKRQGYKLTGSPNQKKHLSIDGARISAETDPVKKAKLLQKLVETYEKLPENQPAKGFMAEGKRLAAIAKGPVSAKDLRIDQDGKDYIVIDNRSGSPRTGYFKTKAEAENAAKEIVESSPKTPTPPKPTLPTKKPIGIRETEEVRARNTIAGKNIIYVDGKPVVDEPGRQVRTSEGKERYGESIGEDIKPAAKPTGKLSDLYKLSAKVTGPMARDLALKAEAEEV